MSVNKYNKLIEGVPCIEPEMLKIRPVRHIRRIRKRLEASPEIKAVDFLVKIARKIYDL